MITIDSEGGAPSAVRKLNILQGGIIDKFIPSLTEKTKKLIEGSFKITGDKQLQQYALTPKDQIELSDDELEL